MMVEQLRHIPIPGMVTRSRGQHWSLAIVCVSNLISLHDPWQAGRYSTTRLRLFWVDRNIAKINIKKN